MTSSTCPAGRSANLRRGTMNCSPPIAPWSSIGVLRFNRRYVPCIPFKIFAKPWSFGPARAEDRRQPGLVAPTNGVLPAASLPLHGSLRRTTGSDDRSQADWRDLRRRRSETSSLVRCARLRGDSHVVGILAKHRLTRKRSAVSFVGCKRSPPCLRRTRRALRVQESNWR
jgi:hypothetical protein